VSLCARLFTFPTRRSRGHLACGLLKARGTTSGMNFTLTQEQYEALIALARKSTVDERGQTFPDKARSLDNWLKLIEQSQNPPIIRSALWVQWQEVDSPLPPGTEFPAIWPPNLRAFIELVTRKVTIADVNSIIQQRAKNPVNILVTPDPGAQLGWTTPAAYFAQ
jgi:hypothetical protein